MTKIFVAAPFNNEPQIAGYNQIIQTINASGFEAVGAVQAEDAASIRQKRSEEIEESEIVVAWLDGLYPPGEFLYKLFNVNKESITIPLPENIINMISIGMQATGQADVRPKEGLILPGQEDRGIEVANVPRSFTAHSPGGIFGQTRDGVLNLPASQVAYEVGFASALKKPIIAIALASPRLDFNTAQAVGVFLTDFVHLVPALNRTRDALDGNEPLEPVFRVLREEVSKMEMDRLKKKEEAEEK